MPEWSTACPDWADRIREGRSIIPPPIFPAQAEEALRVFKELRIVDAPGSPTFGDACAQWVFDLVASIFGAYDADSGRRLITEWFICLPKKNSKSTIAAGIMMTALVLNWRRSAEFSILAPTIEIANNSFGPARDFCSPQSDEELNALMYVQGHIKQIEHRTTNAKLKVLAADAATVGGKKSVGTLIDELWIFGMQPDAENMLREAVGGLASRPEGFVIYLTTQSDEAPAGVFRQKLKYARDVRDGIVVDPCFLPVIFEHPPDMVRSKAHLKRENLAMVNPNLHYSVDEHFLNREYSKAKEAGEDSFRGFMAKHANVEIGLALKSDAWAGAEAWEKQDGRNRPGGARRCTLEELLERCEVICAGIDGGGLDDLLGLSMAGRDRDTGEWLAWCKAWAHPIVLERRKSEATKLLDLAATGHLVIVDDIGQDVDDLAADVARVFHAGLLYRIGVDPSGLGTILDALKKAGIPEKNAAEEDMVVGISQGFKLNGTIMTTERKLAEGTLWHGGSELMNWCVGNAKVEQRGNAILITKQASGKAKIDPLMSLFNAVALLSLNPEGMGSMDGWLSSPVMAGHT